MTTPTTRYWIGGRGNQANNPNDWTPKGKPQAGDTLIANTPTPGTMNVTGNDLAGNTLVVRGSLTINTSDNAVATVGDQAQALYQFTDIHVAGTDTLTTLQQFQQWSAGTKVTVELNPGANLTGSFGLGAGGSGGPQTASLTLTGAAGSTWHRAALGTMRTASPSLPWA